MMSLGMPMILMGDEVRRTQDGNNNAYCYDDENNWFDWTLVSKHADLLRFVKLLIARRRLRDAEHEQKRISLNQLILQANKAWHGTKLNQPDWGDYSHSIAFTAEIKKEQMFIHFIFNSYWEPLEFELPPTSTGGKNLWLRWIDTSLDSPNDICDWQTAPPITESTYLTAPRSVVVLWRRSSD